ncbi:MAG: efflux RND transporter periplasmic adaptor subunit [Endozoicomonas sp.]
MFTFKKPSSSWQWAMVVSVLLAIYLLSAEVTDINGTHKDIPTEQGNQSEIKLPSVNAEKFTSVTIPRTLTLYGRTGPDRTVIVSAEYTGQVSDVSARRGALVKRGQELVQIEQGSLPEQLDYARARVRQTQLDLESAQSLQSKKLIAENQLPQLEVAYADARSQLKRIEIQLADTRVQAPISGILNERRVERGDYIEAGKPVAELLDLDPLVVTVDVPQDSVMQFSLNDLARVRFLDGHETDARIRYISRKANDATRTFSLELEVANPGMIIPAGLSIEADLLMDEVLAIEISPALIALNERGVPGIKWVAPDSVVHFTEAQVVKTDSNSMWLTGVPEDARIITRGQGFVRAGDNVLVANDNAQLLAGD